jgi:hypothetical protein
MGDKIIWGGNDVGVPSDSIVRLLGTPEYCPNCGIDIPEEYVICIEHERLAGYRLATPEDIRKLE